MSPFRLAGAALASALLFSAPLAAGSPADDAAAVSVLDVRYQAAVKANDADAMDAILHDGFVLVVGSGATATKADLLAEARSGDWVFEQQDEEPGSQTVRVFRDTAVVTAKLWLKGAHNGKAFERKLWFSDTYVRTAQGWKYAFGQASLPLPAG